jgi:hypothetical protein
MESTLNRAAVDIGPPQARPGLALVLGLLSLPGSTIAWQLPVGGLWIGLPLGLAVNRARHPHAPGTTTRRVLPGPNSRLTAA